MTAQVSDIVVYKESEFSLVAFSDGEPFDPRENGYRPVMASTACYRGYVSKYAITEGTLVLSELRISHQEDDLPVSQKKLPPNLNEVVASKSEQTFFGRWLFQDVRLPLQYTGGIVIAKGFIRELYVHMGFHPAWKYEEVYELVFESGKLVSESNLSDRMREVRERARKESECKSVKQSREEVEVWVHECFRRDYRRKR